MSDARKFIFCEGRDDELALNCLVKEMGLDATVEPYNFRNKLPKFLRSFRDRSDFVRQKVGSIAILRDADDAADGAFASVCDSLRQNQFPTPTANETFAENSPRIGVFIVGVNGKGMLEDLCLQSVASTPEFGCVDDYFECIKSRSTRREFHSKARFRVWMASHEDFEDHAGQAAERGMWRWDDPAFGALKSFLKQL